jgi:hypothetical protein
MAHGLSRTSRVNGRGRDEDCSSPPNVVAPGLASTALTLEPELADSVTEVIAAARRSGQAAFPHPASVLGQTRSRLLLKGYYYALLESMPMIVMRTFHGRQIAAARALANVSIVELACEAGVTARTVTRLETIDTIGISPKLRHGHVSRRRCLAPPGGIADARG